MIYAYRCFDCKQITELSRSVNERDDPVYCAVCACPMKRLLALPVLITRLLRDEPENKYAFGFSERDRYDLAKADEKVVAKQWETYEKNGISDAPEKPMTDIAREMGVSLSG